MDDNRAADQQLVYDLVQMHLHTSILVNNVGGKDTGVLTYRITRVPGGWLYVDVFAGHETFVPLTKGGLTDV